MSAEFQLHFFLSGWWGEFFSDAVLESLSVLKIESIQYKIYLLISKCNLSYSFTWYSWIIEYTFAIGSLKSPC